MRLAATINLSNPYGSDAFNRDSFRLRPGFPEVSGDDHIHLPVARKVRENLAIMLVKLIPVEKHQFFRGVHACIGQEDRPIYPISYQQASDSDMLAIK